MYPICMLCGFVGFVSKCVGPHEVSRVSPMLLSCTLPTLKYCDDREIA